MKYGTNTIGKNAQIFEPVTIGFPSTRTARIPHSLGWGGIASTFHTTTYK